MMFPPSATSVAALSTASKRRLRSSDLGSAGPLPQWQVVLFGYGFGPLSGPSKQHELPIRGTPWTVISLIPETHQQKNISKTTHRKKRIKHLSWNRILVVIIIIIIVIISTKKPIPFHWGWIHSSQPVCGPCLSSATVALVAMPKRAMRCFRFSASSLTFHPNK